MEVQNLENNAMIITKIHTRFIHITNYFPASWWAPSRLSMRLDGSRDESEAEVGQGRFFRRWEEKRFSKGRTAERAARSTTSRHFRLRELVSQGIPATPIGQLRTSIRQIERAGYHYDPILWSSLRIAWIISSWIQWSSWHCTVCRIFQNLVPGVIWQMST